jgi:hypothetical protein
MCCSALRCADGRVRPVNCDTSSAVKHMGGAAGSNRNRGRLILGMFWLARSKEGSSFDETGAARYPLQDVRLEPTNTFAAKSLFSRKLPDRGHAVKRPRRSPDEPSDVMSGENLIPRRVGFIYPPGDGNSLTDGDAGCIDADLNGICSHKRPSCVVPVVQGQVATYEELCASCRVNGE